MTERVSPDGRVVEQDGLSVEYPFNGGMVSVTVNPADLRENTVQEAIRQGLDEATTRAFMEQATFYLAGTLDAFVDSSNSSKVSKRVRKAYNMLGDSSGAGVWQNEDGTHCAFDIAKLVKGVDRVKREAFKLPDPAVDLVGDSKEVTLQQIINLAWTHERQHLIQHAGGMDHTKSDTIYRRIRKGSVRTVFGGLGYMGYLGLTSEAQTNPTPFLVTASAVLGTALIIRAFDHYQGRYSPHEREAYKLQNPNSTTPFQVTFKR